VNNDSGSFPTSIAFFPNLYRILWTAHDVETFLS